MEFSAVYSFHESNKDRYSWMTFASILTLRHIYPKISIRCFVSRITLDNLSAKNHPLLDEINLEIIDIPDLRCDKKISRYLKIFSGLKMDSSFIYIDSDTLVVRPISIPNIKFDLGLTSDKFTGHIDGKFPDWAKKYYEILNWKITDHIYYNSGVVIYNENILKSGFFRLWLNNWMETCSLGLYQDQPSFNHTINNLNLDLLNMGHCFNAMVQVDDKYLKHAEIMHFYESASSRGSSKYTDLINDLKRSRKYSGKIICENSLKWKHIFYEPSLINLIKNRRFDEILKKISNRILM